MHVPCSAALPVGIILRCALPQSREKKRGPAMVVLILRPESPSEFFLFDKPVIEGSENQRQAKHASPCDDRVSRRTHAEYRNIAPSWIGFLQYLYGPVITSRCGAATGAGVPPPADQKTLTDQRRMPSPTVIPGIPSVYRRKRLPSAGNLPAAVLPMSPRRKGNRTKKIIPPPINDRTLNTKDRCCDVIVVIRFTIESSMVSINS